MCRHYFHQIIEGLEYIHNKGFSHRDLKPENLLFTSDFELKIADFGFSSKRAINLSTKGTPGYVAPEIYAGIPYSGNCTDLFSAAIILFILRA